MVTVTDVTDIELNGDREVFVDGDQDLATVSGEANLLQSVAIEAGDALRPLVGEPITGTTFEDAQTRLREILQDDPQISNVVRVRITEIDKSSNTVKFDIVLAEEEDFSLEVTV